MKRSTRSQIEIQLGRIYRKDKLKFLENINDDRTKSWVDLENNKTQKIIESFKLQNRFIGLWKQNEPMIYFHNCYCQNSFTYVQCTLPKSENDLLYKVVGEKELILLFNPRNYPFSDDDKITSMDISPNEKLLAIQIAKNGQDKKRIAIVNLESHKVYDPVITDISISFFAWRGNDGFVYSKFDPLQSDNVGANPRNTTQTLYYHSMSQLTKKDKVVFGGPKFGKMYVLAYGIDSGKKLVIGASNSVSGNELYLMDMKGFDNIVTISNSDRSHSRIIGYTSKGALVLTNKDNPMFNLTELRVNPNKRLFERTILKGSKQPLRVFAFKNYIISISKGERTEIIKQFDLRGMPIRTRRLPVGSNIVGFQGELRKEVCFYQIKPLTGNHTIFSYNLKTGKVTPVLNIRGQRENNSVVERTFYKSFDNARIPMTIISRKGIQINPDTPALVHVYGGMGKIMEPTSSLLTKVWIDAGGLYVVPHVRGGGEKGRSWHKCAVKLRKKTSMKDLGYAIKYLINKSMTSTKSTTLWGESNGAMVVASAIVTNLMKCGKAILNVGLYDMIRYPLFGKSRSWFDEYGDPKESTELLRYLESYSPYHQIKKKAYPATLIIAGMNDDRVSPVHSYKFAAKLLANQTSNNPIMLRAYGKGGHGDSNLKSLNQEIEADIIAFLLALM